MSVIIDNSQGFPTAMAKVTANLHIGEMPNTLYKGAHFYIAQNR
jgi:hypothetical protein